MIAEGVALVERALSSQRFGPYSLQAAIAAVHAEAPTADATDWAQIVGLYDVLVRADRSPVVELNRAAAVAMRDGPAAGLALIDAILARGELADYQFAHSARGELLRRLGRSEEARAAYERALALTNQETERRFLARGSRPHRAMRRLLISTYRIRSATAVRSMMNPIDSTRWLFRLKIVPALDAKSSSVKVADHDRVLEVELKEIPTWNRPRNSRTEWQAAV